VGVDVDDPARSEDGDALHAPAGGGEVDLRFDDVLAVPARAVRDGLASGAGPDDVRGEFGAAAGTGLILEGISELRYRYGVLGGTASGGRGH
jgi:hypothetical protein